MRLGASARPLLVNEMFAGSLPGSIIPSYDKYPRHTLDAGVGGCHDEQKEDYQRRPILARPE